MYLCLIFRINIKKYQYSLSYLHLKLLSPSKAISQGSICFMVSNIQHHCIANSISKFKKLLLYNVHYWTEKRASRTQAKQLTCCQSALDVIYNLRCMSTYIRVSFLNTLQFKNGDLQLWFDLWQKCILIFTLEQSCYWNFVNLKN